jgi:hypothetical protein
MRCSTSRGGYGPFGGHSVDSSVTFVERKDTQHTTIDEEGTDERIIGRCLLWESPPPPPPTPQHGADHHKFLNSDLGNGRNQMILWQCSLFMNNFRYEDSTKRTLDLIGWIC